jgi:hypothetical protein
VCPTPLGMIAPISVAIIPNPNPRKFILFSILVNSKCIFSSKKFKLPV